jgi:hypothetical protein
MAGTFEFNVGCRQNIARHLPPPASSSIASTPVCERSGSFVAFAAGATGADRELADVKAEKPIAVAQTVVRNTSRMEASI